MNSIKQQQIATVGTGLVRMEVDPKFLSGLGKIWLMDNSIK